MRLSKSKINTYLKCPLEFKFQYVDEIEAKPNKYMILGSDVHSVAETFADKFGDELENVNIENELLKIKCYLELDELKTAISLIEEVEKKCEKETQM